MQNFQREVENWRQSEIQEAEMELENLMKEPEVNPARSRPSNTPQEKPALRPNIPDSLLDEAQEDDVQKRFQNLRNPSEFSPVLTPPNSAGVQSTSPDFTLGSRGQDFIPQAQAMRFNQGIPYPGLDGHPRRITPIPISTRPIQSDKMREGYAQVAKTIFGAKIHDPAKTKESTRRTRGVVSPLLEKPAYRLRRAIGF